MHTHNFLSFPKTITFPNQDVELLGFLLAVLIFILLFRSENRTRLNFFFGVGCQKKTSCRREIRVLRVFKLSVQLNLFNELSFFRTWRKDFILEHFISNLVRFPCSY